MSNIEEMFLKAADFRVVIRPGEFGPSSVGWLISTRWGDFGSYTLIDGPITKPLIREATALFKMDALDTLLLLIGSRK